LVVPVETGAAAYSQDKKGIYLRHTAAYENVGPVVSFAQQVNNAGRPLWPCPGMGVIKHTEG
jgi:hypothetical protein